MAITVRNLITNALISCDAIAVGETPDDNEIFRGLQKFNDIVSQLSLSNMWSYTYNTINFTLVPGQSVYTIGPDVTNDIVIADRPNEIVRIQLNNNGVWYSLDQLSEIAFFDKTKLDNTQSSDIPYTFTYRPAYPDGEIELYPKIGTAYTIRIQTRDMKVEYTLDDELALPPGYNGYLEYALAAILAVDYGSDPSILESIAATRLGNIKRQNFQPRKLRYQMGMDRGSYDINSDTFIGGY